MNNKNECKSKSTLLFRIQDEELGPRTHVNELAFLVIEKQS